MSEKWKKLSSSWYNMIRRCHVQTDGAFKNYGARGIEVCDRWRDDTKVSTGGQPRKQGMINFYEDMQATWFPGASIDRIDNDGNYCPENCQWLTRADNTRRARQGSHRSAETKEKIRKFQKGRVKSAETRNKLSIAAKLQHKRKKSLTSVIASCIMPVY